MGNFEPKYQKGLVMKKLFMYFALALTVLAMPAMAQATLIDDWTLDLSTYTGDGADVWDNIEFLRVDGDGTILQNLGDNWVIDEGETFTASSVLYTVRYKDDLGYHDFVTSTGDKLSFASTDLSGYVDKVNPDGSFTYAYTGGTVQMLLGNTLLAELTLDWAAGQATDNNLGGNFLQGDTDMSFQFITAVLGSLISFDPSGYPDLGNYPWLDSFLVFDLNNSLVSQQGYTDQTTGDNMLMAGVATGGSVTLVATPEPSTFLILGFGLLGLAGFRRKFKKA